MIKKALKKIIKIGNFICKLLFIPNFAKYIRVRIIVKDSILGSFLCKKDSRCLQAGFHGNEKYFLWNQPNPGFSHQVSLYIHGIAIGKALNRTVILNYMELDEYHNRDENGKPRACICNPKIYFNFEKLNSVSNVTTIEDLDCHQISGSMEHVDCIDLNKEYHSKLLFLKEVDLSDNFYCKGFISDEVRKNASLIIKHLEYSKDIKDRARRIIEKLGDYDAIQVRRGDALLRKRIWRGVFISDQKDAADSTNLSTKISKLSNWISPGRKVYIATDERDLTFFDGLRKTYDIYFKEDFLDILHERRLPKEARNNNYYLLCIEEIILSCAYRFVGTTVTSPVLHVDLMRKNIAHVDRTIYNFSMDRYAELVKKFDNEGIITRSLSYQDLMKRRSCNKLYDYRKTEGPIKRSPKTQ